MAHPQSNASIIDQDELKQKLAQQISSEIAARYELEKKKEFRAALAGEIMATLAGAAYSAKDDWTYHPPWSVVADDALEAADALIKKLEEK